MGIFNTIFDFIQNPGNSWILYSIAFFMIIEAIFLRVSSKKMLKIKGNNAGIVVNGDVEGDITQTPKASQASEPSQASELKSDLGSAIGITANISGILGLVLAAATFYISYMK